MKNSSNAVIKAIKAAADRETRAMPTFAYTDTPAPALTHKVGTCGRFIMGYVGKGRNIPSRLCDNPKGSDQAFCDTCCNYVRFAMHRAIPDRMARELWATTQKEIK